MKPISFVCIALFFLSLDTSLLAQNHKARLERLFDQYVQLSKQHDWSEKSGLPDRSIEAINTLAHNYRQLAADLSNLPVDSFCPQDQISIQVLKYHLSNHIDLYKFKQFLIPLTTEGGFYTDVFRLASNYSFDSKENFESYLEQLRSIPGYFDQNILLLNMGLEQGITMPRIVLNGAEKSIEKFLQSSIADNPFYKPFVNISTVLPEGTRQILQKEARAIIANQIIPAYQKFYDYFLHQYRPGARQSIGVSALAKGEAFYHNRVRHYTTSSMTADEIYALGLAEVKRIRKEMQDIIDRLDFEGDFSDFLQFLRNDSRFYAETEEDLLEYVALLTKKIDARLPQIFDRMPRMPYGIAPVPDAIAPKYTIGRYLPGSYSRHTPGYYWVNTYDLKSRPLYVFTALSLHEAVPGHHFQIMLAQEPDELPEFRRNSYISAFGEGWALYAEFLGIELGLYDDPYDDFGRLSYEMWRACRLVVDVGIHLKDWTREKAIQFMLTNTALAEHDIITEVDRYISWPGQALSYKIGELKIKELRLKAENALGIHFDIRRFHNEVLSMGHVPLYVLARRIEAFIETEQKRLLHNSKKEKH